jgi:hypothetical protein
MLQIIGWLGCAMLAVKLLEMAANPAMRQDNGSLKATAGAAMLIGWASVIGFALWLLAQGTAFPDLAQTQATGDVGAQLACIDAATTSEEVAACTK